MREGEMLVVVRVPWKRPGPPVQGTTAQQPQGVHTTASTTPSTSQHHNTQQQHHQATPANVPHASQASQPSPSKSTRPDFKGAKATRDANSTVVGTGGDVDAEPPTMAAVTTGLGILSMNNPQPASNVDTQSSGQHQAPNDLGLGQAEGQSIGQTAEAGQGVWTETLDRGLQLFVSSYPAHNVEWEIIATKLGFTAAECRRRYVQLSGMQHTQQVVTGPEPVESAPSSQPWFTATQETTQHEQRPQSPVDRVNLANITTSHSPDHDPDDSSDDESESDSFKEDLAKLAARAPTFQPPSPAISRKRPTPASLPPQTSLLGGGGMYGIGGGGLMQSTTVTRTYSGNVSSSGGSSTADSAVLFADSVTRSQMEDAFLELEGNQSIASTIASGMHMPVLDASRLQENRR
eukprot:GFYU01004310.1.p1 GENE.GFYU01004310.1~~GFYU01004310.1.p1  ORF type:complete len:405 (+),score=65.12 GFYU01004310.1:105-1319(+)